MRCCLNTISVIERMNGNNENPMIVTGSREEQILLLIRNCLEDFREELSGRRVVLFGSRAKRTARPRSDFDLGAIGPAPMPLDLFFRIEDAFERLPTLYKIDWVDLSRASEEFRKAALSGAKEILE